MEKQPPGFSLNALIDTEIDDADLREDIQINSDEKMAMAWPMSGGCSANLWISISQPNTSFSEVHSSPASMKILENTHFRAAAQCLIDNAIAAPKAISPSPAAAVLQTASAPR